MIVGTDELLSEAYAILTECALPPRERLVTVCAHCNGTLENVRSNAKFSSCKCKENYKDRRDRGRAESVPAAAASHIGAMWTWPEAERGKYAVREVGYRLNN